jgi:hypothetical protein
LAGARAAAGFLAGDTDVLGGADVLGEDLATAALRSGAGRADRLFDLVRRDVDFTMESLLGLRLARMATDAGAGAPGNSGPHRFMSPHHFMK